MFREWGHSARNWPVTIVTLSNILVCLQNNVTNTLANINRLDSKQNSRLLSAIVRHGCSTSVFFPFFFLNCSGCLFLIFFCAVTISTLSDNSLSYCFTLFIFGRP